MIDLYATYELVRRLSLPFEKWPAYKLGIINAQGEVLRPRTTLSSEERKSWTYFDTLVLNLKRIIEKMPYGTTRLASYVAALWLLREPKANVTHTKREIQESYMKLFDEFRQTLREDSTGEVEEDAAANCAGGGGIAGIGVGPAGEPAGLSKMRKKKPTTESDGITPVNPAAKAITEAKVTREQFAGNEVFVVDSDKYHACRMGKKQYHRYDRYVGDDAVGEAIRQYGRENPAKPIIVRHAGTGAMLYLKYGKKLSGFNHHQYTKKTNEISS